MRDNYGDKNGTTWQLCRIGLNVEPEKSIISNSNSVIFITSYLNTIHVKQSSTNSDLGLLNATIRVQMGEPWEKSLEIPSVYQIFFQIQITSWKLLRRKTSGSRHVIQILVSLVENACRMAKNSIVSVKATLRDDFVVWTCVNLILACLDNVNSQLIVLRWENVCLRVSQNWLNILFPVPLPSWVYRTDLWSKAKALQW